MKSMLLNFKVKNFRSIRGEIDLDLHATEDKTAKDQSVFVFDKVAALKSIAIFGPNASGKSNVLKAFGVFRRMVLESQLRINIPGDLPNEYFKLSTDTEGKPSSFEVCFSVKKDVFYYGFEISKKAVCSEWLKRDKGNISLFERHYQDIKSNKNYFKEASANLKTQTTERVLFLTVLASNGGEISTKIVEFIKNINYVDGTQRGETLNYSFGQFINNPEMATKMKEFIIRADFGVDDIKASEKLVLANEMRNIPDKFKELLFKEDSKIAERSLKFVHKKYNNDEAEIGTELLDFFMEESEGTQQMFALAAPIIDTLENGGVLFVDEIDSSLHPLLCQYLVSSFNSLEKNPNGAQLIFTTHDTSLMNEEYLRRDQIYFTDKDKGGATELYSLADISERKKVDFAKRYLEGRYNALPYISDFENMKFSK